MATPSVYGVAGKRLKGRLNGLEQREGITKSLPEGEKERKSQGLRLISTMFTMNHFLNEVNTPERAREAFS